MKPTLYLETTVPSYYVSRLSRDVVVLAHQTVTRLWWEVRLPFFHAYVSPVVLEEAAAGDPGLAQARLDALEGFSVLEATAEVERVARVYLAELALPERALRDAAHLAFACAYGVDYLVTWNCAHIANAEIRRSLETVNSELGIRTPIICTPEELMGVGED